MEQIESQASDIPMELVTSSSTGSFGGSTLVERLISERQSEDSTGLNGLKTRKRKKRKAVLHSKAIA